MRCTFLACIFFLLQPGLVSCQSQEQTVCRNTVDQGQVVATVNEGPSSLQLQFNSEETQTRGNPQYCELEGSLRDVREQSRSNGADIDTSHSEGSRPASGEPEGVSPDEPGKVSGLISELQDTLFRQKLVLKELQELLTRQEKRLGRLAGLLGRLPEPAEAEPEQGCKTWTESSDCPRASTLKGAPKQVTAASVEVGTNSQHGGIVQYGVGRVVLRPKHTWADQFKLLAAVKTPGEVSAMHVLPQDSEDGLSRYVAIGDSSGRLSIYSPFGRLFLEHQSACSAAITAILAVQTRRNETVIVTGHADGCILSHILLEEIHRSSSHVEDFYSLALVNEHVWAKGGIEDKEVIRSDNATGISPVVLLEKYQGGQLKLVIAADAAGELRVFRVADGKFLAMTTLPSPALAFFRPLTPSRSFLLTASGLASLHLPQIHLHLYNCTGLNDSSVAAYALDTHSRSKAYGVVEGTGEMVMALVAGQKAFPDCRMRVRLDVGVEQGPIHMHAIEGYLIVTSRTCIRVFNTTTAPSKVPGSSRVGGPRPLYVYDNTDLKASVGLSNDEEAYQNPQETLPRITGNKDRLVVVAFKSGVVAMFRSELLVDKRVPQRLNVWNSPFFILAVLMIGGWQFYERVRSKPSSLDSLDVDTENDIKDLISRVKASSSRGRVR